MSNQPGIALANLIKSAKDSVIREFLDETLLQLFSDVDQELVQSAKLKDVLDQLIDPVEILKQQRTRDLVIDLLPISKARELADRLSVSKDKNIYTSLKVASKSSSVRTTLESFFGVVRLSGTTKPEYPTKVVSNPSYGLYDHQREAASKVEQLLRVRPHKVVLHMPTGSGKTRTSMHIVANHLRRNVGTVVCWLAYSAELLEQAASELKIQRDRLLREQKKGTQILAEVDVTQDILKVLRGAYERITNEELQKVSDLMNSLFLEMIGADPKQGAIIQRAEINRDFDIVVYGPHNRTLNPDRDLNGASRRALTLSFILALTKVSEVQAPNVIDTPLGMTSDFVKRSILSTAVRESTQLILFLTPAEIAGCEEIIDAEAGKVLTLTNPAHYPKMLVNDPGVVERKVLRCECDHRETCELCQRRSDAEVKVAAVS